MENLRSKGLGGHDIAVICGVYPFERTPYDVYLEKVKGISNFNPTYIQKRGLHLESFLLEEWLELNPEYKNPEYEIVCDKRYVHPIVNYFHAHPDVVIFKNKKPIKILEFKAPVEIKGNWGEEGTFEVPDYIKIQTQWYQFILDCYDLEIVVEGKYKPLIYKADYVIKEVEYMTDRGADFWINHVTANNPPAAINLADTQKMYPFSVGEEMMANNELVSHAVSLQVIRKQMAELTKKENELKFLINEIMKEKEAAIYQGKRIITNRTQFSSRVDTDAVRKDKEAAEKFLIDTHNRVIRIYL